MRLVLDRFFDLRSLRRGSILFRNGTVLRCDLNSLDSVVSALVQRMQAAPYSLPVILDDDGEPGDAECSRPVAIDCKHAVAAVLAHQAVTARTEAVNPGGSPHRGLSQMHTGAPSADDLASPRFQGWWTRLQQSLDESGAGWLDVSPGFGMNGITT